MYWFAMAWSMGNIYIPGVVPRHQKLIVEETINTSSPKPPTKSAMTKKKNKSSNRSNKNVGFANLITNTISPDASNTYDNHTDDCIIETHEIPMHQPETITQIKGKNGTMY